MRNSLVLRGGLVLGASGPEEADVLVEDGGVAAIGPDLAGSTVLSCEGCWVGPGLGELHTHLREPGQEWKEDVASGSAAAAVGGYTAVMAMPNTDPAIDSVAVAELVRSLGDKAGLVEVRPAGAITAGRRGGRLADLEGMLRADVSWFTDDGDAVADPALVRNALEVLSQRGGVLAEHAEEASLTAGAHMHEGSVSSLLGVRGMPASAESVIIARDILIAADTGARLHIQHLSTEAAVELVAAAKSRGIRVTSEVTPHHLALDHTELKEHAAHFKMKPPLRRREDVEAVRGGLRDGTIDAVATDHAPHAPPEANRPLKDATFGVIGLETAAAVVNTAVELKPREFFDRLSVAPARLGGFTNHGHWTKKGVFANLAVFDPKKQWVPGSFVSRSSNSPFVGRPLRGKVRFTVYQGRVTHGYNPSVSGGGR